MAKYSEDEIKLIFFMGDRGPGGHTEKNLRGILKKKSSINTLLNKMIDRDLIRKGTGISNGKKTTFYNSTSKMNKLSRALSI